MADNVSLLLAAIARLEQKLSAKIDSNFNKMKQLADEGLQGLKEEMAEKMEEVVEKVEENAKEVVEQMDQLEDRILKKLDVAGAETNNSMEDEMNWTTEYAEEREIERYSAEAIDFGSVGQLGEEKGNMADKVATRRPRKKSKKITFKGKGSFTMDEMLDCLSKFEEDGRELAMFLLWNSMDLELSCWREKRGEIWQYDGRRQPKEFDDLKPDRFLIDPSKTNLCFLQIHILARICEMLSPLDFVELSLTCRFLHWRMFAFCTCHAPYTIQLRICDENVEDDYAYNLRVLPSVVYVDQEKQVYRGMFVGQPSCLKKPFSFQTLQVNLETNNHYKKDYDRCLPYILAARKFAKNLCIYFRYRSINNRRVFDVTATNEFFEKTRATSFLVTGDAPASSAYLWATCDYTRMMNRVFLTDPRLLDDLDPAEWPLEKRIPWTSCPNQVGFYESPPLDVVMETLDKFLAGDASLQYHIYMWNDDLLDPLLKRLFENYSFQEEYAHGCRPAHRFYTTLDPNGDGRRVKIAVYKQSYERSTAVAVGKEDDFKKWESYYVHRFLMVDGHDVYDVDSDEEEQEEVWRMQTALEADDGDDMTKCKEEI